MSKRQTDLSARRAAARRYGHGLRCEDIAAARRAAPGLALSTRALLTMWERRQRAEAEARAQVIDDSLFLTVGPVLEALEQ